ncbi:MAG TPA: hypothetical protein PLN21_01225 [Gemmatales bacterium]|nr:hypothetical protein [Gemmatales bacterium]
MSIITADARMKSLFLPLTERTEIRDDQGQLIGIFTPQGSIKDVFDDAEFEKRRQTSHHGYSIDEVREHLRSLERSA